MISYNSIGGVVFSIINDKTTITNSCVAVTEPITFREGVPVHSGIVDTRMGVTNNNSICLTCLNYKKNCLGHFGHVKLNYPVQSPLFYDVILQVLKILCLNCSGLFNGNIKSIEKFPNSMRLSILAKLNNSNEKNKQLKCKHCNAVKYNVTRDKKISAIIWIEHNNVKKKLYNHQILKIFKKITDKTLSMLGKSEQTHPKHLIQEFISIPPNSIRPDYKIEGSNRSSIDEITAIVGKIVSFNKSCLPNPGDNISKEQDNVYLLLDTAYYTMIKGSSGNTKLGFVGINGSVSDSISTRIAKDKKSLLRGAIMGKTSSWAVRNVITPSNIPIDSIQIPISVAKEIQLPEVVSFLNFDRMMCYFRNNKMGLYPKCVKITKKSNGSDYSVANLKDDFVLEYGDIVYRDLITGDIALFNRAPSLLPSNLTSFKLVVSSTCNTFTMNISICNIFAADFDGDQMTLYFTHSLQTNVEMRILSSINNHFISRGSGGPSVGILQDDLIGLSLLTDKKLEITKLNAMRLSGPNFISEKKSYSGYDIISMVLPDDLNYSTKSFFFKEEYTPFLRYEKENCYVSIKNGKYLSGVFDYNTCGEKKFGSLFHIMYNQYGAETTVQCLTKLQRIGCMNMFTMSLSTGIKNFVLDKSIIKTIKNKVYAMYLENDILTKQLMSGNIIPPMGVSTFDYYQNLRINNLTVGDDITESVISGIDSKNTYYQLITYGNKGKIQQFIACMGVIGTVLIGGKLPPTNFGFQRTLPYYSRFDLSPEAYGFIPNPYISSIPVTGLLLSSGDARFNVISRVLTTCVSGAQSRELIKNLETNIVDNMRHLISGEFITQFLYAENGFDTRKSEYITIPTILLDNVTFEKEYKMTSEILKTNTNFSDLYSEEFKNLSNDRQFFIDNQLKYENVNNLPGNIVKFSNQYFSPLHLPRIIEQVKTLFKDKKQNTLDINKAFTMINEFIDNIGYLYTNNIQRDQKTKLSNVYISIVKNNVILIRSYLNFRTLIRLNIDCDMLSMILNKITISFQRALVDLGAPAGILTASYFCEPLTQDVISSHHKSGVSKGVVKTNKLVRAKEIFNGVETSDMENPSMVLYFNETIESDLEKIKDIANNIECTKIREVIGELQIFYEQYKNPIHPEFKHEKEFIEKFEKLNVNIIVPSDLTRWCIRLELDIMNLIVKNIRLEQIIKVIMVNFPYLHLVYNSEVDDVIIIRCYVRLSVFKKHKTILISNIESIKNNILDTPIKGIPSILKCSILTLQKTIQTANGLSTKSIYVINTTGSNLKEILKLPYFDYTKCRSDSVREMESIYGIECARTSMKSEFEGMFDGIHKGHFSIIVDTITKTGTISGISKNGVNKREPKNTLLSLSYRNFIQEVKSAAINNKVCPIVGPSSSLIFGKTPKLGSTYNDIYIDYEFINNNSKTNQNIIDDL